MLLSKTVKIRWNGFTRKWYEDKGYKWTKLNDYFDCKIEDVQENSTAEVEVQCDYCNEVCHKQYREYLNQRKIIDKDCCGNRKCMVEKSEEISVIKYGVKNYSQTDKSKQHLRQFFQTPVDEILDIAKNKNINILNIEEYKNDRTRLLIVCNNHKEKGIQETNYANIKKNKSCCFYGGAELTGINKRLDGQSVYDAFLNAGYEPLFKPEDYKGNSIKLPYICPKHKDKGTLYMQYGNLQFGEKCSYCAREIANSKLRLEENKVFNELKKKGLMPIEGQRYKNKDNFIYYKCVKHPEYIQHTSYGNFKVSKQCCDYCRNENSISRLSRRLRSSIGKWRKESEKECNYKCVLTGSKDYDIHHLYAFNNIIKEALSELNIDIKENYNGIEIQLIKDKIKELHIKYGLGICLDKKIHNLFHILYSKDGTKINDYNEFKERYYNGEFDDKLEEELKSYNSIKKLKFKEAS